MLKKSVWKSLVRVFDSSASREGTRAPGEETQGIRPPFLNFFLNVLSFNTRACVRVISLSLSLSLSGSFLGVLASMSVRIDSLFLSFTAIDAADVRTARSARIRINTTAGEGVRVAVVPLTARIVVVVIITGSTSRRRRRRRRQSGKKRRRLRA